MARSPVGYVVALIVAAGLAFVLLRSDVVPNPPPEVGVSVVLEPRSLQIFPLKNLALSEAELRRMCSVVPPYFGHNKIPIQLLYHSSRVWGPDAPFGPTREGFQDGRGLVGKGLFLRILTNTANYQQYSRFTLNRLIIPSPYGVQVVSTSDGGWGQEWGSTHIGKYLQVMGEMRIPSTRILELDSTNIGTLADVVRDEATRLHLSEELEWVAIGLGFYLEKPSWSNRFGQILTMDALVEALVKRPMGTGACLGTHVPFSLAALLNLNRDRPFLSAQGIEATRSRLKEIAAVLTRNQQNDGSWDQDWFRDARARPEKGSSPGTRIKRDALTATGHHLEWTMICDPDLRPPDQVLTRACVFLNRNLPEFKNVIAADFHVYLPASHAVHAVLLAAGRQWAEPSWALQPPQQ